MLYEKKEFMYFKYIVVVFFIWTTMAFSQSAIVKGTLYDDKNVVLTSVEIGLLASNGTFDQKVYSDNEGKYEFTNVPYGTYTLFYSKGNVNDFIAIDVNKAVITHDLFIYNNEDFLDNIDIVVQSKKQQLETNGYAMNVISMETATVQSIETNDLLDRTAGVKIRQDGGLGSKVNYNINGLSGNSIRIFIDGIPVDNFGGSFSLNSIPPASIERIDVYKGVVPPHLSEDALGGAINIILKQKRINSLDVSGSYGSFNTSRFTTNGSYRSNKGFTVNGTAFYNYSDNNFRVYGPFIKFKDEGGKITYPKNGAKRFHDAYESYGTKVNVGYTGVKWADKFFVGGLFSKNYNEIQNGITMDNVYGDRHTRQRSAVFTANYDKRDFIIDDLSFKVDVTYSDLRRQLFDNVGIQYDWSGKPIRDENGNPLTYTSGAEVGDRKTLEINDDRTFALRTNLSYKIFENNTIYFNYFFNSFKRDITDEYKPLGEQLLDDTRDLQKNIVSIAYENLAFNKRLRTNIFYKNYSQKVTNKEPKREAPNSNNYLINKEINKIDFDGYGVTLSYRLRDDLYLLGSAERAIRMPSPYEIFGNKSEDLLSTIRLKPEKSFNGNIGFNAGPFRYRNHLLSINTTLFYRNTKDMIRLVAKPGGKYSGFENLEDVLSRGVDIELSYSFKEQLMFNFSISKFEVLFNKKYDIYGAPYNYYKTQIRNEPSFKFNANLSYAFSNFIQKSSKTTIYYNIYYVEKFRLNWSNIGGTNLAEIPTQYPNDIGVSYQMANKQTTISFDAKNIFNQHINDNYGLQKPGRAFYMKVTHSFF